MKDVIVIVEVDVCCVGLIKVSSWVLVIIVSLVFVKEVIVLVMVCVMVIMVKLDVVGSGLLLLLVFNC